MDDKTKIKSALIKAFIEGALVIDADCQNEVIISKISVNSNNGFVYIEFQKKEYLSTYFVDKVRGLSAILFGLNYPQPNPFRKLQCVFEFNKQETIGVCLYYSEKFAERFFNKHLKEE